MKTLTLSVNEILRFANHDYLNQLQLIKMNLDLEKIDEAKKIIDQISEHAKILSNLNKLNLPKTVEWLQTIQWRFPIFEVTLISNVFSAVDLKYDDQIVEYLEKTVIHVYDSLDPYTEQQLNIDIKSKDSFQLIFELKGNWEVDDLFIKGNVENLKIETYEETNQHWKYALSLEQE